MMNRFSLALAAGGLGVLFLQGCGGSPSVAEAPEASPAPGAPGPVAATGQASSASYALDFSISAGAAGAELSSPNHVLIVDSVGGGR